MILDLEHASRASAPALIFEPLLCCGARAWKSPLADLVEWQGPFAVADRLAQSSLSVPSEKWPAGGVLTGPLQAAH